MSYTLRKGNYPVTTENDRSCPFGNLLATVWWDWSLRHLFTARIIYHGIINTRRGNKKLRSQTSPPFLPLFTHSSYSFTPLPSFLTILCSYLSSLWYPYPDSHFIQMFDRTFFQKMNNEVRHFPYFESTNDLLNVVFVSPSEAHRKIAKKIISNMFLKIIRGTKSA